MELPTSWSINLWSGDGIEVLGEAQLRDLGASRQVSGG
jgi:hypothetical protein